MNDEQSQEWSDEGNSFEVAVEHAAERAFNDGVEQGTELVIAETRIRVGPGSHVSDYIVILKRPG
jgi:hypothetical protein